VEVGRSRKPANLEFVALAATALIWLGAFFLGVGLVLAYIDLKTQFPLGARGSGGDHGAYVYSGSAYFYASAADACLEPDERACPEPDERVHSLASAHGESYGHLS
jgi:hypothetical protein